MQPSSDIGTDALQNQKPDKAEGAQDFMQALQAAQAKLVNRSPGDDMIMGTADDKIDN